MDDVERKVTGRWVKLSSGRSLLLHCVERGQEIWSRGFTENEARQALDEIDRLLKTQ